MIYFANVKNDSFYLFSTNLVTHASSPIGTSATRSPFVDIPTSIAARSEKDCQFG